MSPDLSELRARCLVGTTRMAKAGFTPHVTDPVPDRKMLDEIMLREQKSVAKEKFLNVGWAEKCRLLAKPAIFEQMKRRQNNLFGRFQRIDTVGSCAKSCWLAHAALVLSSPAPPFSLRHLQPNLAGLSTCLDHLDLNRDLVFHRQGGTTPAPRSPPLQTTLRSAHHACPFRKMHSSASTTRRRSLVSRACYPSSKR